MPSPSARRNLIIVFMDDMGYGDMGCFGSTAIKTPHMDAVADAGIRFTQMYAAAPVCTPSRCALLTGRHAQRAGLPRVLHPSDTDGITAHEVTMASRLKDADLVAELQAKMETFDREVAADREARARALGEQ